MNDETAPVTAEPAAEVDSVVAEEPKPKRTRKAKPAVPTVAERVADLKPLPWNALHEEIVNAHNELLKRLQGGD